MYFPSISPRRGAGGAGAGSGAGSGAGRRKKKKTTSGINAPPNRGDEQILIGGVSYKISAFSNGSGALTRIPRGQPFAGRAAGGATRSDIYGTRSYGSGYPGLSPLTRGVAPGSGFPFIFWSIVWKSFTLYNAFHRVEEFGSPSNATRPGGALATLDYVSAPNRTNTSIQILADTATLLSLSYDIYYSCSMYIDVNKTEAPVAYDTGSELDEPGPEQVIQYYRASSVALILDGYNNSAVYPNGPGEDTPLLTDIDLDMISCFNSTIGGRVPLVEAYRGSSSVTRLSPSMFSLSFIYLLYVVLRSMRIF